MPPLTISSAAKETGPTRTQGEPAAPERKEAVEPEPPPSPASTTASPDAEAPEAADLETAVVVSALATDSGSPTRLYAGTSRGLRRSPDSGQSWVAAAGSIAEFFISAVAVDPTLPSVVYASTEGAGIFQSTDAGVSWTDVNRGLANLSVERPRVSPRARPARRSLPVRTAASSVRQIQLPAGPRSARIGS